MGASILLGLTILLSYVNQVHLQMFHPRDISRGGQQQEEQLRRGYLIQILKSFLNRRQEDATEKRKRSCNLNLGFHCQTDEYSSIADMYDFLQSALSPGKRKRNVKIVSIEGS
ncbi:hypothetical protein LOTGIDRAFT_166645 [Lottia gigantea]|uniref:Uncharacterized protein n=1 Tax=Lottia gigantea TaxID=225164 RepID=V3ZRG0_LOTGI|nr:hypothetical protein LOTGIDRAFT_166645 [Lottia gigantea]ESO86917.1 hypothetical protein LOTGIDRAFT_166645 [Lottia gigantea]